MRRLPILLLSLMTSSVHSDVIWERAFDSPGPAVGEVFSLTKETTSGAVFAYGSDAGQNVVWKFNRWGSLFYRAPVYPGKLLAGKHGDFFIVDQDGVCRYDSISGQLVWRQTESSNRQAYVDEVGDIYTWDLSGWAKKFSFADGTRQWQVECGIIPVEGPDLIANTSGGAKLLSKATGVLSDLTLPIPASGKLAGAALSGGKAVLQSSERRLYGFRGRSKAVLNLGLLDPKYGFPVSASNGGVLFSGSSTLYMDPNFQMGWTSPIVFGQTEDNLAYKHSESVIQSFSLQSGSPLNAYYATLDTLRAYGRSEGKIWLAGTDQRRPTIEFVDEETNVRSVSWKSASRGFRRDQHEAGILGPGGDLILLATSEDSIELSRIAAASGDRRWVIDLGPTQEPIPNLSISNDKRTLGITRGYQQRTSYEIDVTTAKVVRSFSGWGLVDRGFAYRQKGSTTSKFDLSNGREIWRVPRTGPLSVDADGTVYIGSTKNSGSNGQLIWTCPVSPASAFARAGSNLIARSDGKLICVSPFNGQVVWSISDYASFYEVQKPECRVEGSNLFVRNGDTKRWKRFDIATGVLLADREDGFWGTDGSFWAYRIANKTLFRYASFTDLVGVAVAGLDVTPRRYVLDGGGDGYFLGTATGPRSDWDVHVVRWQ